ncbi:MAG: oligosaccharide flippase family protein [Pricia sp.]
MKKQLKKILQKDKILNLVYRVLTILFKFLLSIIIVKKLSVYDLGVFGIFQTTVMLMIYVLGFDFYTYNTRELLKKNRRDLSFYIGNQILFHSAVYLIVLPCSLFLFFYDVISTEYLLYFYLILVAEHISQEIYRILIVLKKSVTASLTLFLRAGLWILALYAVWTFNLSSQTIRDIFIIWAIGGTISIIVGVFQIPVQFKFRVDLSWIRRGIRVAAPFLVATLFYKVIEFSGRYFLDFYSTKEEVGIFTFFSGISNAMFVLVQSTVIIVMSPYLIESVSEGLKAFQKVYKDYQKQVLYTTGAGTILASICIHPLLYYLDNDLLNHNVAIFYLLLMAVMLFCFSYIPHYGLYSYHKDKSLLWSSIIGALSIIVANFMFVPEFGVLGAAVAQVLGMLVLLVSKLYFFNRLKHANQKI